MLQFVPDRYARALADVTVGAMRYYEYYPADPDALRANALDARSSASALYWIGDEVASRHRKAIAATDGELVFWMTSAAGDVTASSRHLSRAAIWAALQIEEFADAIEVFNSESADPMSIERLNARVAEINQYGILRADCVDPGAVPTDRVPERLRPDSSPPLLAPSPGTVAFLDPDEAELALQAAELADLNDHHRRLVADLDAAAEHVAQNLKNGPDEDAIVDAWKAGNLPPEAALAWPELGLEDIPIDGVDPRLLDATSDDIPDLLTDRSDPLTDEELEWLRINFPDEMADFADNWDLDEATTLPPGYAPGGMDPDDAPYGWIQGPDGAWYPVEVPPGDADDPNSVQSPGWTTVASRLRAIETGDDLAVLLPLGPPPAYGPQSVGDQDDYWAVDSGGNLVNTATADDRPKPWEPGPSGPYPQTAVEAGEAPEQIGPNPSLERFQKSGNVLDLLTTAGQNVLYNQQLDDNNSYAGGIAFQHNSDGDRRVVVQLGQIEYDPDSGEVLDDPDRRYGILEEDGNFATRG